MLFPLGGEAAVSLISPAAVAFTAFFLHRVTKALTGSVWWGLAAQVLLVFSPVVLWYAAQLYMEPLMGAWMVLSVFALVKYHGTRRLRTLAFVVIAVSGAAITKQTGLIAVVAAVAFFVATKAPVKHTAALATGTLALILLPYALLFATIDGLVRPNPIPLAAYERLQASPSTALLWGDMRWPRFAWSRDLDAEVDASSLYTRGRQAHVANQVPLTSIWQPSSLVKIHTLYPRGWLGIPPNPALRLYDIILLLGLAATLVTSIFIPRWRAVSLMVLVSYLFLNIAGDDTKRFMQHLTYLTPVLTVAFFYCSWQLLERASQGRQRALAQLGQSILAGVLVGLLITSLLLGIQARPFVLAVLPTLQGGFPSSGGVASIAETGRWIQANSSPEEVIWSPNPHEWHYQARRANAWASGLDYRAYFLPQDRIAHYMCRAGVSYVILQESLLVPDRAWNHIERIPTSFAEHISSLYPLAYESPYGDVRVYRSARSPAEC